MGRPENKKNLQGDIPAELHDALTDWIAAHRDVKIRQVLAAMVEMWLALPESVQATLLISPGAAKAYDLAIVRSIDPLAKLRQMACDMDARSFDRLTREEQDLVNQLREWAEDARLAEETVADALAIEAEMLGKTAGTGAGSKRSEKSQGRKKRKTG
jgi:hypothetical protein